MRFSPSLYNSHHHHHQPSIKAVHFHCLGGESYYFSLIESCCCFVYYVTWHTWLNTLLNTISTVFKCPQNIESPSLRASQFLLLVGGSNSPVAAALDRNSVLLFMNNSIIHGAMANHNRTNEPTQRTILKACDHVWSPSPHHKTNFHFHNIIIPLGVPFN